MGQKVVFFTWNTPYVDKASVYVPAAVSLS